VEKLSRQGCEVAFLLVVLVVFLQFAEEIASFLEGLASDGDILFVADWAASAGSALALHAVNVVVRDLGRLDLVVALSRLRRLV